MRSKYADVKKRLQRLQLKYTMLYPARLQVTAGQAQFFETAPDVAFWLNQHKQDLNVGDKMAIENDPCDDISSGWYGTFTPTLRQCFF